MREKEFINKIHKKLPKEIYKWKINDPYHGGVPDTFYSGPKGFAFFEYKYIQKLPKRKTSKIKVKYPISLFPVLKTLVAPMFPEPTFLISFFKKIFVNINPKGIDPIR